MTVKHPAKCDIIPAERPFLLAAERAAIASATSRSAASAEGEGRP